MSSGTDSQRSGKLRFKRSREERKRGYERSDRREQHRDKGKADGEAQTAGPSRHPPPLFGDDLLRAERFEARADEERAWSRKLGDLLHDDVQGGVSEFGGGAPTMGGADDAAWEEEMMRLKGREFSGDNVQEIPKRWRDAANGFESRLGRGAAGLKELDEEEYIRDGMHRRKHATEIAFEEDRRRAWEESQAKKRKARDERRAAKRQRQEVSEKEAAQEALARARSSWERRWVEMAAQEDSTPLAYSDLPWPTLSGPDMTKESVQHFLLHESEKQEASQRLRKALLRYHPDRFLSSRHYARIQSSEERERTRQSVERVAKVLNEILHDRRG